MLEDSARSTGNKPGHMMQKRTVLTMLAAMPILSACGFRLRGAPDFQFKSIYVKAQPSSQLARELVRNLKGAGGNVTVITDVADIAQAVGYAAEASFATAFRRVMGETPGRWRRHS